MLVASTLPLMGCGQYDASADERALRRVVQSAQYDVAAKVFRNRRRLSFTGDLDSEATDHGRPGRTRPSTFAVLLRFIANNNLTRPASRLPEVKPDLAAFLSDGRVLKTIWLGHSTFLVLIGGKVILFDPVLSDYASPVSGFIKRFQPPVLSVSDLPDIDTIVISHDHYDHLDYDTIVRFRGRKTRFLVPLGVGAHLRGWGIAPEHITELDWWQEVKRGELRFTLTPAQHFSGRGLTSRNATLWGSWVVRSADHRMFFSGDGGYDNHFKKIGRLFGPFDIVFLENGQYSPDWPLIHLLPKDGARAFRDLQGKRLMPVHWGMFDLSTHNWYDPIEAMSRLAKQHGFALVAPKLGEIVDVKRDRVFPAWWRLVMHRDRPARSHRSITPLDHTAR